MMDRFFVRAIKGKRWTLTSVLILLLLASGCGASSTPAVPDAQALERAPEEVAALYRSANCISCHGIDLQGRIGPGTNLQQVGAKLGIEEIAHRIAEGDGVTMPAYKDKLTTEEISQLSVWLSEQK